MPRLHPSVIGVVLCMSAPLAAHATADSDGDGVNDTVDALPCDPTASAISFAPAEGSYGMIMFEDLWPSRGDLDFNDVVLAHQITLRLDAAGHLRGLHARFEPLAIGGTIHNGLGFHLPVPRGSATTITRTIDGESAPLTPSAADAELTLQLLPDLRALFGGGGDEQINSRDDLPRRTGSALELDIVFAPGVTVSAADAPFDTFLFQTARPSHEIHRPQYAGTAAMDTALFGTSDDGSGSGRTFVDTDGLPFALLLPTLGSYPSEATEITRLFPTITTFAASGGLDARDFYVAQVNGAASYRDSAGAGALSPTPIVTPADRSCDLDLDGDGEGGSTDCDDNNAAVHHGVTEICNGLDDNCDGAIDEGSGTFSTFHRDADGDGFGDGVTIQACSAPPGYVAYTSAHCNVGTSNDCNVPGTTLIASSSYLAPQPPAGWVQCAGFVNTNGNDVTDNFLDNCLGATGLRIQVRYNGALEEDISATNINTFSAWPNWNYLGGSVSTDVRTRWGTTTFFTTTTGRDACNQVSAPSGTTFGSGNGAVAIVAGGNAGADEYRVNCGGASLPNREIAIFRTGNQSGPAELDCDDDDAARSPGRTEICNGIDDDCDGQIDDGNPGGGGSCATGQLGACGVGVLMCTGGAVSCMTTVQPVTEVCGNGIDDDCDGAVDEGSCARACSNGSSADCNVAGTTLIGSSAWVDPSPPAGWTQCAGFTNTSGNDVAHNFFDNCLSSNRLRIRVVLTTGAVEEDITVTGMNVYSAWPNWNYLGGSASATTRTRWGTTTFFTTTTGRDACNQVSAASGNTFGTGNGGVAIVAGGNTGADEYRVSCGGAALVNRRIAIFR